MKAVCFHSFGGSELLRIEEVVEPAPKNHEVKIQVANAGVNPVDWKIREGYLKDMLPHEFPIIPGWDVAGTISQVGNRVSHLKVGEKVFAYCRKPVVQWGTYAEFVCFDADHVVAIPKNLSLAQASSIPLAGLTAWQALVDAVRLKRGETVLIHAGAGGVGSLAIGIAKWLGAKVLTTTSDSHHIYVKSLGADVAIDYTKQPFDEVILKKYPEKLDVVLDCVGGKTLYQSLPLLKDGGRIVSIVKPLKDEDIKDFNINAFYVFVEPNGKQLNQLKELIEKGQLQPPGIEEIPLEKASVAQDQNKKGHTEGKIVLTI